MTPFFSIIIPTYNRAAMLPAAIKSILAQTFTNWELVIVDDGSTDNTKQVVATFVNPRIKYIYQDNAERSAARNNGIANSTGTYIGFLDSDDYYMPQRLQGLYDAISKKGGGVNFFYTGVAYDYSGKISKRPELKNTYSNIYDFIALAVIGNPQACIHRDILTKYHFDKRFYIGEDMELWLRIVGEYPPIYLDDQFTIVAVEHDDRSVNVKRYNSFSEQLRLFRYVFSNAHPGKNISPAIQNTLLANCYFGIAKYCIHNGLRSDAIGNIVRSILADSGSRQLKFRINVLLKLITFSTFDKLKAFIEF